MFFNKKKKDDLEDKYNKMLFLYNELEEDYIEEQEKKKKEEQELNEKLAKLENEVQRLEEKRDSLVTDVDNKSLEYIDNLKGLQFEEYTKVLLTNLGYENVEKTKASGDFGIDILAEKDFMKYAIQCKLYSSPLGPDPVQEVYAGRKYYNADIAVVLTNSTFSKAAIDLANKTNVILWDRNVLEKMVKKVNGTLDYDKNRKEVIINENESFENDDPLLEEIIRFTTSNSHIKTSTIQRKFRLGYNKAATYMDIMEGRGIIGPMEPNGKPRKVLVYEKSEDEL